MKDFFNQEKKYLYIYIYNEKERYTSRNTNLLLPAFQVQAFLTSIIVRSV